MFVNSVYKNRAPVSDKYVTKSSSIASFWCMTFSGQWSTRCVTTGYCHSTSVNVNCLQPICVSLCSLGHRTETASTVSFRSGTFPGWSSIRYRRVNSLQPVFSVCQHNWCLFWAYNRCLFWAQHGTVVLTVYHQCLVSVNRLYIYTIDVYSELNTVPSCQHFATSV